MRLIDANALMEDICESLNQMTNIGVSVDGEWLWGKLNDALEHAPTIEGRKTGEWISVTNGRGGHECSMCHLYAPSFQSGGENLSPYCPNCGADMRGEQDEID